MANVVISVWETSTGVLQGAVGEYNTGTYITSSNPVQVLAGDTVTFKVNMGGPVSTAYSPVTFSGFASTHWTNTANDTAYYENIFYYDFFTKTIKSPPTSYSTDTIAMSVTGASGSVYVQTIQNLDTTPDLAGVLGFDKYNGTTSITELINFTLSGITAGQTITITSSASGGTGATCKMSNTNMNGTYTTSITAVLGDLIWVEMYSGSELGTTITFTISSNGASDTRTYKTGEKFADGDIMYTEPASGAISASNFMWQLGCHEDYYNVATLKANKLSAYYYGKSYVPGVANNSGVPTEGNPISFSQLYNVFSRYFIITPIQDRFYNANTSATQTHTINFGYADYTAGKGQQQFCSEVRISSAIIPVSVACYDSNGSYIGDQSVCFETLPTTDNNYHRAEGVDVTFKLKGTTWTTIYATFFMTVVHRNILEPTDATANFPLSKLLLSLTKV